MTPAEIRVAEVTAGHERGWSFTPLNGKKPVQSGWQRATREALEQALAWAEAGNVGLRTGTISGLVVIDVDPGGHVDGLNLPPTVTALTGRPGGKHLYYRSNGKRITNSAGKLGKHIDVRGDGGQVVFVGSVHPETHKVYSWAPGLSPNEIGLATLPAEIADRLTPKRGSPTTREQHRVNTECADAALEHEVQAVRHAPEGQRNAQLNKSAFTLGGLVATDTLDRDLVIYQLREAALAAGLDEYEIDGTIESGLSAGATQPWSVTAGDMTLTQQARLCSDVGNAARFAIRERERVRYCYERDQWYVWDGRRWLSDAGGEIASRAKRVALSIFDEAKAANGNEALGKWAACSQRRERLTAMIEVAKPELRITPRELDADDWLLNCGNGTVDLRSGELRPHRQDDYITRLAPVDYDPNATSDVWDRFLATVTDGDVETQTFLQRAAGYSATGLTTEEKLFFVHGHGATGKSTFIEAVKTALGDYATTADFETFLENRNTGPRNDVAALDGARLVASVEVSDGRHLAQGLVKMLTGGDTIRARFLYREGFEFTPKFTLWLVANHAPLVDDMDDALWRRMVRIPFEHVIPETKRDHGLKLRLKTDPAIQTAILRWIVDGCLNWRDVDLNVPETIRRATEQYREDQNPLGDFITDRCITGAGYQAAAGELRAAYLAFAAEVGLKKTLSPRSWAERLRSMGFIDGRAGAESVRVWHGIGLLR